MSELAEASPPLDESVRLLQILETILSGPLYTNEQAASSWEAGTLAAARHCFQAGGLRLIGPPVLTVAAPPVLTVVE